MTAKHAFIVIGIGVLIFELGFQTGVFIERKRATDETPIAGAPPALARTQQQRLQVFYDWATKLNAGALALSNSGYAHDVKIQSIAITKDNTVCGELWFRRSMGGKNIFRYALPDGDRIAPYPTDDDRSWNDMGCQNAAPVVIAPDDH